MKCQYCQEEAIWCENKTVYGKNYGRSYMMWLCKPCDAYVGCHHNTERPLGTLANRELRELRKKCHKLFDEFWHDKESRTAAYMWLQDKMGLHRTQAHIGKFDKEKCLKLITIIKEEKI